MSNLPENENLNNIKEQGAAEEFSTVFSAPAEHKKQASDKTKKRWPKVVAAVLAVAVLIGGTVAVVKLIPEREENTVSTPAVEEITVLDEKSKDYKTVTVTNSKGTFKFYSVTEVKESTDTASSGSTETVTWYLDGYDKSLIDTYSAGDVVGSIAAIKASREITEKSAADCGLSSPAVKVEVVKKDNSAFTATFGSLSPDNSGVYMQLSTSDKIYLVDTGLKDGFEFVAIDFAESSALPAIGVTNDMTDYVDDSGALKTFDSITLTGANLGEKVVIEPNDDSLLSQYMAFIITSPARRIADKVDEVYNLFKSGLSVSGTYSFDVSAATLKKFGLDNPDFVATMKAGKASLTYKFKLQSDGNYAVICDSSKTVKYIAPTSAPYLSYKVTDFYSSQVCLVGIDNLKGFKVTTPEKTYEFGITVDSSEDAEEKYIITYEGKKLTASNFQSFYQLCISLSCNDFTVDSLSDKPEYAISFIFNDEIGTTSNVEFIKASATKYQCRIDGMNMGKINSSDLKKIAKYVEMVARDEKINYS